MKTRLTEILLAAFTFILAGCSPQQTPPAPTSTAAPLAPAINPAHATSFNEVTRELDAGGSVYVYLATDQWLANLSTNISELRSLILDLPDVHGPDREKVDHVFTVLSGAAAKSGLEQLTGIGISGIQIAPELYRTKFIAHHRVGEGGGVLWNIFGKSPHALRGLDFLTQDTGLASFGDVDIATLWKTIDSELANSGVSELARAVTNWPAEFEKHTRTSWPKLLASFGGEAGFVLTLDKAHKMSVPFGKQSLEMPEPGLLAFVKINDDLIYDRISSELLKNEKTTVTEETGLRMCSLPLPAPVAVKVHLTVASSGGYLFVASSPEMVRNALAVRDGKLAGLRKSPDFEALMKYLPAEGNQFFYADQSFSATIMSVQKQLASANAPAEMKLDSLQKFFFRQGPSFGLSVSGHTPTGWQSISVGNRNSATALVGAPVISGIAVAAAVALPALAKAKTRAQDVSCVNNMKQIGLAFRIWEGDNNDQFPFNVSTNKGGTLEWCDRRADGYDRNSFRHLQTGHVE